MQLIKINIEKILFNFATIDKAMIKGGLTLIDMSFQPAFFIFTGFALPAKEKVNCKTQWLTVWSTFFISSLLKLHLKIKLIIKVLQNLPR